MEFSKKTRLHQHNGTENKGEEDIEVLIIPLVVESGFLSSLMYVKNANSENPIIYTITNETLQDFVNNQLIEKNIRESVLMTFINFDNELFGSRLYSSIPLDLFENVPAKEQAEYKTFAIIGGSGTHTGDFEAVTCFEIWHCKGGFDETSCDGCGKCKSNICFMYGGGGSPPDPIDTTPTNPNTGESGSSGGQTNPNVPWYLQNSDVDIFSYSPHIQDVFKKMISFKMVLQTDELNVLRDTPISLDLTLRTHITQNNNLEGAKFVRFAINFFKENPDATWEEFHSKTPCEKIASNFADTNFKSKVTELDKTEMFDNDEEDGYVAAYGAVPYEPLPKSGNGNLKLPIGNKYFGFIHVHLNLEGSVKIFSPADVATFLTGVVRNANTQGKMEDAYGMVITSGGNYMLKYTGDGDYGIGPNQEKVWKKWYEDKYQTMLDDERLTQPNVEKLFTQFLKEIVKINGLEVYKTEKSTGKASKMEYDGKDKPIKTTLCS